MLSEATHAKGQSPQSNRAGSKPGCVIRAELLDGLGCHSLYSTALQVTARQSTQVQRPSWERRKKTQKSVLLSTADQGRPQEPRTQGECLPPLMGMSSLGFWVGISPKADG